MKKFLMGTSALIAAGLAGTAQAAEPIKVGIEGYVSWLFTFGNQTNVSSFAGSPDRADQIKWDGEIQFKGRTQLDNGLRVGFVVELEAFQDGDQIDKHYIWFEDTWGRFELGATAGAANQLHVYIPNATPGGGVDTPDYFHFSTPGFSNAYLGSTAGSDATNVGDANKIVYFSPKFAGFQFGVSYAPEFEPFTSGNVCASSSGSSTSFGACFKNNFGQWQHSVDAALRYEAEFNDVSIAASVGGLWADAEVNGGGLTNYKRIAGGLSFGFSGFIIGGAFRWTNQGLTGDNDQYMYGLGITYTDGGAWTFGIAGSRVVDKDDTSNTDKLTLIDGGATYNLGPGVDLFAGAQWAKFTGNQGGPDSSGIKGYFGTKLTF
ncbi:MAG: porin [Reyranellaceae bacterium]